METGMALTQQHREHKDEVITFKVESQLAEILKRMPNRSQFIRSAILNSLEHVCPLCQGLGGVGCDGPGVPDEAVHELGRKLGGQDDPHLRSGAGDRSGR